MVWMLTGLILLISGEFLKTVESSCTLNAKQYDEGQTWHPDIQPFGSRCVECTCKKGEVKCRNTVKCPPVACANPKTDPRMCCPVCEDFDNLPPTVDNDNSKKGGKSGRECVYGGKKYSHGEVFPSNSTGIVPTTKSQCVNCACTNGQVFCHLKTCEIPKGCSRIIRDKQDCCPKCADAPEHTSSKTIKDIFDCEAAGQIRRNNTQWNPSFSGSQMPCVTCKCLNGLVNCQKKECPKLSCRRKRKPRKGQCCETCRNKKRRGRKPKNKKKKKSDDKRRCKNIEKQRRGNRKNKKGKRKGRRKVNRGGNCLRNDKIDTTLSVDPSLPSLFTKTVNQSQHCLFKNLCLPRKTKYLVYRHFVNNSHAFFAFDDLISPTVDVWRWNVTYMKDIKGEFKDVLSDFKELQYPADWFRKQITGDKLNVIFGAARKKRLSTFKRRLKRTFRKCVNNAKKPSKRCTSKILLQELICADFEEIYRRCGKSKS